MTAKTLDVVGIGNAIVDVLVQADDDLIDNFDLTKGTMALVDEQQAERLYAHVGPGLETSGGSAANTLAGIAQLGGRAGFIGGCGMTSLAGSSPTTSAASAPATRHPPPRPVPRRPAA